MKRMLSLCLVITLLLTAIPIGSSMALSQYGTVTGGWLRLRSGPSFDSSTVNSYYTGTQVKILGSSGSWYQVETPDGNTGYMYGSYISFSGGGTGTAYVTSSNGLGVRMRTGPGTGYSVVGIYSVGTALTVLQSGNTWSKITIGTHTGYMMNKFITTSGGGGGGTGDSATVWSANGYGVRLRSGAGTGYAIIGVYSVGTLVTVLSHGTTWDYISVGSRTGYMMNEFLRYNSSTVVTAVTLSNTTPVVGSTLSATLTPADATVDYYWYAGTAVVATTSTYTVTSEDVNKQIKLKVTGNGTYTGTVTSALTSAVVEGTPMVSVALNNPTPVVGDVLSAKDLQPANATVAYRWYVDDVLVAKTATYTVTSANLGKYVTLKVVGTGLYTGLATVVSDSVVEANGVLSGLNIVNTTNTSAYGIDYPNLKDVLVAKPIPDTASVTYKWYLKDDPTKILGTSATLVLNPTIATYTILGHQLEVVCTAKSPYSGTFTKYTGEVVNRTNIGTLSINKMSPQLDPTNTTISTLTATVLAATTAADVTTSCDFQWYNDSVAIAGATNSSYQLQTTDRGHLISVTATAQVGSAYSGTLTKYTTSTVRQRLVSLSVSGSTSSTVTKAGEVLTPVLDSSSTEANYLNATYTWTLNGTTASTLEYTVPALSLTPTKTLSLKVVGKGDYYTDEVNYAPLKVDLTLTAAAITVTLPSTALVSGSTYAATVSPATAVATYSWLSEAGNTYSGSSITLKSADIGSSLTLTVTPGNGYTTSPNPLVLTTSSDVIPKEITTGYFTGSNQINKTVTIVTDIPAASIGNIVWTFTKTGATSIVFSGKPLFITIPSGATDYALSAVITGAGDYLGCAPFSVTTPSWTITSVTSTTESLTSSSLDTLTDGTLATDGTTATDDTQADTATGTDTTATDGATTGDTTATDSATGDGTATDGTTGTGDGTVTDGTTGTGESTVTDGTTDTGDGTATDSTTTDANTESNSTPVGALIAENPASEDSAAVSYAVTLAFDTASIGVNTIFTATASPSDTVQSYAWYLNDYQILDAYGSTYRITTSDYAAGNVLKVIAYFSGDHQATSSVTLAYANTGSSTSSSTSQTNVSTDTTTGDSVTPVVEFIP